MSIGIVLLGLLTVLVGINTFVAFNKPKNDDEFTKIDKLIRDEFGRNREESQKSFRENREELNNSFKTLGDTLIKTVNTLSDNQKQQFDAFAEQLTKLIKTFEDASYKNRLEQNNSLKEIRETIEAKLKTLQENNDKKLDEMKKLLMKNFKKQLKKDLMNHLN